MVVWKKQRAPRTPVLVLFVFLILSQAVSHSGPLVLASVPWQKTAVLEEIYQPLIRLLERRLDMEIRFFVTRDYEELGVRLNDGAADLGIFGGNAYVDARLQYPGIRYLATCSQPSDHYNSLIIVRKESGIDRLGDLKGKSFAFTDKSSTSGYVYPLLLLKESGLEPQRDFSIVFFLEKHDKVYDAVARGAIDAGGVSSTAWDEAVRRNGEVFRKIVVSDPIPRNALAAGPHLDPSLVERLGEILASASESPEFQNSSSILKGFTIRSDSFYDIIRRARDAGY
jgi:phosphonate transport system substrate-binding protein